MLVMDLPLWEPSDDQGHVMPFDGDDYFGDSWLFDNFYGYGAVDMQAIGDKWLTDLYYGHDVIEEEALNEKYCVQVLQILMDKTDKEIVKLEEDIVMLQCQLAWDDEEWSETCSAALRENIDDLDDFAHSLTMENTEEMSCFDDELEQLDKVPPRIHHLLKPLLENYSLGKVEQTKSSITQMPVVSVAGISEKNLEAMTSEHDKKVVEKECVNMQEHDERRSLPLESEHEKIKNSQQAEDATLLKCISDAQKCASYKLSEHDLNKLNRLQKKRMPISAPVKSGWKKFSKFVLSNPVIKNSSTSVSTDEGSLNERCNSSNDDDDEVFALEKNTQCSAQGECTALNSHLGSQGTKERIMKTVKKKRKNSPLGLPNLTSKKSAREFLIKMEQTDDETVTNCALKDFNDGATLNLNDLRAIAKKQQLRGYHKLRKAELQALLGLNPEEEAYVNKGHGAAKTQNKQVQSKESKVKVMANG